MATCMSRQASRYVLCAVFLVSLAILRHCTSQVNEFLHLVTPLRNSQPINIQQGTPGFTHTFASTDFKQDSMETRNEAFLVLTPPENSPPVNSERDMSGSIPGLTSTDTEQGNMDVESGAPYLKQMTESKFKLDKQPLSTIGYPLSDFITLTESNVQDFVFVTGANQVFLTTAYDLIGNVQDHFPSRKIIFYDLDVEPKEETRKNISSCCNVEYRRFPFESFPDYVRKLKEYRFKPLIIHMVFQEYSGVYWVDTAIRFVTYNLSEVFNLALSNGCVVMMHSSGIANSFVTNRGMYEYLPTNVTKMSSTSQMCACDALLYRTESIYKDIYRWLVLCALTKDCLSPPTASFLCKAVHPMDDWGCHRYDQSAINILLNNKFDFDTSRYQGPLNVSKIKRRSEGKETIRRCLD